MNKLPLFLLFIWGFLAGAYVGKATAYKEFELDKVRMNLKLRQCLEQLTGAK